MTSVPAPIQRLRIPISRNDMLRRQLRRASSYLLLILTIRPQANVARIGINSNEGRWQSSPPRGQTCVTQVLSE